MGMSTQVASGIVGSTNTGNAGANLTYSQGGGKTPIQKALNSVVQIDPKQMISLLQDGLSQQTSYYQQGLDYYANSVKTAAQQIATAYATSNATLQPISIAGQQAMAEQMKMLGLRPISFTAGYANQLNTILPNSADLQSKLTAAEGITDPQARAAAKQDILTQLQSQASSQFKTEDQLVSAISKPKSERQALEEWLAGSGWASKNGSISQQLDRYIADVDKGGGGPKSMYAGYLAAKDQAAQAQSDYDKQVADAKVQAEENSRHQQDYQSFINNYQQYYSPDEQRGYTGAEVQQKIESTPGYSAQMAAGTNAIARKGAALGMLGSGNTVGALGEFGANLAANTYNNYMQNLSQISGLGSQATMGIANNQVGQGNAQSQLSTGLGSAYANTYQGIGNNIMSANQAQANLLNQVAQFNAAMQYNSKQANLDRAAAANASALGAAASMAPQMAQFGYNVYNQQQQANSFAANYGGGFLPSGYWNV